MKIFGHLFRGGPHISISNWFSFHLQCLLSLSEEVENLAYFMRFAQAALSKAAADMERQGFQGMAFQGWAFGVRRGFQGKKNKQRTKTRTVNDSTSGTLPETNIAQPIKLWIFHGYVSFREGNWLKML